jgi:two-component system, response regulator FlrC
VSMPASLLEVADTPALPFPVASSASMREALQAAGDVAASPTTVLLLGESGTGKEILARFLHDRSQRPGPWVAVNCAALPAELLESELFGYERGAFTGAGERRAGRFEQAQHGTLLLDEVSELPLPLQAKLLRVLQEREVDRIGGQRPIPVDVRVVATSNRDLGEMVRRGLFRSDLFYRLNVFPITLPPLRSRREDLPALASQLLAELAAELGRPAPRLDEGALEPLSTHPFPGNVRELRNVLERALVRCRGSVLGARDLALDLSASSSTATPTAISTAIATSTFGASGLPIDLSDLEKLAIAEALRRVGGNRTHAARLLGIGLRTLRNKLRLYRQAGVPMESAGMAAGQLPPTAPGDGVAVSRSTCRARPSQEERS